MTSPTLIVILLIAAVVQLAIARDIYAGLRNEYNGLRAGTGARHRRPGPALPWHRRSELDTFTRSRPRPVPVLPHWDDLASSTQIIHPVAQLRALDLTALQQLAATPFLAVAA